MSSVVLLEVCCPDGLELIHAPTSVCLLHYDPGTIIAAPEEAVAGLLATNLVKRAGDKTATSS